MGNIELKRAIRGLKVIEIVLAMLDIFHCPLIPKNDTSLFVIQDNIKMHLSLEKIEKEVILKIEELEVTEKNNGLGSLILFIITSCMQLSKTKIGLWTVPGNEVVENWYKKLGFVEIRTLEKNKHKWFEKEYSEKNDYYKEKINSEIIILIMESIICTFESVIKQEKIK